MYCCLFWHLHHGALGWFFRLATLEIAVETSAMVLPWATMQNCKSLHHFQHSYDHDDDQVWLARACSCHRVVNWLRTGGGDSFSWSFCRFKNFARQFQCRGTRGDFWIQGMILNKQHIVRQCSWLSSFPLSSIISSWQVQWYVSANHAGGYSYRLCKMPERGIKDLTEECFQERTIMVIMMIIEMVIKKLLVWWRMVRIVRWMKVILILQETPLDFVGDKQWVVYANQVPSDTHIPSIYMWPRNFFLTQYFSKGNVFWNIPVCLVYQCNILLSYTQDHRTQVSAKRTTEGTFPPGLI